MSIAIYAQKSNGQTFNTKCEKIGLTTECSTSRDEQELRDEKRKRNSDQFTREREIWFRKQAQKTQLQKVVDMLDRNYGPYPKRIGGSTNFMQGFTINELEKIITKNIYAQNPVWSIDDKKSAEYENAKFSCDRQSFLRNLVINNGIIIRTRIINQSNGNIIIQSASNSLTCTDYDNGFIK